MFRTVKIILTCVCLLFLFCTDCDCGADPGTAVTYEVDGFSRQTSIYYHDEYGDMHYRSSVAMPWIHKFKIKYKDKEQYGGGAPQGNYLAYISASVFPPGHVTVKIYIDGKLVREEHTRSDGVSAMSTATARYAVFW